MRVILLALTALALVITGYIFWWNKVADIAVEQAEKWKQDRIEEGYTITNTPFDISGFPYRVKMSVQKITIEEPENKHDSILTLTNIWAVAQPWNIKHLIFGLNGSADATWNGASLKQSVSANAGTALGSATVSQTGKIETLAIDIKSLMVKSSSKGPMTAERLQIHGRPAAPGSANQAENTSPTKPHQYSVRLDNLSLNAAQKLPLGNTIKEFSLSVLLEDDLKNFKDKEAVTLWRNNGGFIDIQDMIINWGESQVSAKGTLALDDVYRPIGAFRAQIGGFNALLKALVESGKLEAKNVQTAVFALNLLAKTNEEGARYLDVPISIQDGALSLGPLFLMRVEPLL